MILNHRSDILTIELGTRELTETIDGFLVFSLCCRNLYPFIRSKGFQLLIGSTVVLLHLPIRKPYLR
jgi:hypothetical protein